MADKSVHLFIEGRVQGVWYRAWTIRRARKLGLAGWVRNRRDGRVEAVICGDGPVVEQMIKECFSGPPAARVDRIEQSPAPKPDGNGFEQRDDY